MMWSSLMTEKRAEEGFQELREDLVLYLRNSTESSASLSPAISLRRRDPTRSQWEAKLMSISSLWGHKHVRKAFRSSQSPTCAWYPTCQTNLHIGTHPPKDLLSSSRCLFSSENGLWPVLDPKTSHSQRGHECDFILVVAQGTF